VDLKTLANIGGSKMRFLRGVEELVGKTIDRATFDYCDETLVVVTTEGDVFAVTADQCYDSAPELIIVSRLEEDLQVKVGLLSEEEYTTRRKAKAEEHAEGQRLQEISTLARLTAKYKGA
jgi:hypothetical protein